MIKNKYDLISLDIEIPLMVGTESLELMKYCESEKAKFREGRFPDKIIMLSKRQIQGILNGVNLTFTFI